MAGLGLGGLAMARWADEVATPLRTYGYLEIGIGLYVVGGNGDPAIGKPMWTQNFGRD